MSTKDKKYWRKQAEERKRERQQKFLKENAQNDWFINLKRVKEGGKIPARRPQVKIINCFKCLGEVMVRWVFSQNDWSMKNNWGYWTEKEENREKFICNTCLKDLVTKIENQKIYWTFVPNRGKRQKISTYLYRGEFG